MPQIPDEQAVRLTDKLLLHRHFLEVVVSKYARQMAIGYYGYSIPMDRLLTAICGVQKTSKSPILEVGAGHGYWSALLRRQHCEIVPCDLQDHNHKWTTIEIVDAFQLVKKRHFDAVFMSWPTIDMDLFLKTWKGKTLIIVKEPSASWSEQLDDWEIVQEFEIPRWVNTLDEFLILQRP